MTTRTALSNGLWICLFWLICAPISAMAGAWTQEEGSLFVSFGGNVALFDHATRPVHYDPTIFLEYGLSPRLTLGLDGYTADKGEAGSLFGFARTAIGRTDGPVVVALAFGLGLTKTPTGPLWETVRIGGHLGQGLDRGWLALDAEATRVLQQPLVQTKMELTWGHRLGNGWTSVLSGQIGSGLEGDFYAKMNPSLTYDLTQSIRLRAGYVQALTGDRGSGLSAKVWVDF